MTPTPVGMRCPDCAGERTQVRTAASIRSASTNAMAVTFALIAANVVAFLASGQFGFGSGSGGTRLYYDGVLYGPTITGHPTILDGVLIQSHQYWRLVTYGFLHVSIIHIGFNMFLLYILGQMLEPVIGHVRFGIIYFVALLGGACGALILSSDVPTVGASGAVFGLMGAAAVELRGRGHSIMEAGIGGLIIINLLASLVLSNVSIGGHIGGLAFGAVCAYGFHLVERRKLPSWGGYAAAVALALIAVIGSLAAAQAQLFNGQLSL